MEKPKILASVDMPAFCELKDKLRRTGMSPADFIKDAQVRSIITVLIDFQGIPRFEGITFKEQDGVLVMNRHEATNYLCITTGISKMHEDYPDRLAALENKLIEAVKADFEMMLSGIKDWYSNHPRELVG